MTNYKMSEIKDIEVTSPNHFLINWNVTKWCNYHCSYCHSNNLKNTFKTTEELIQLAEGINSIINTSIPQDKYIYFKIIGGEVAFFDWPTVLDHIDRIGKIAMTTNFSNNLDYYKKLYEYMRSRGINFVLMCSQHDENTEYINKIIELSDWCSKHAYSKPICRLMVTADFDYSLVESLRPYHLNINLSVIRDEKNITIDLPEDLKKHLEEYYASKSGAVITVTNINGNSWDEYNAVQFANKLDTGGFIPRGFTCSAGHNGICVDANGDILASHCKYWATYNKKILGNVLKDKSITLMPDTECKLNDFAGEDCACSLCWFVNLHRIMKEGN